MIWGEDHCSSLCRYFWNEVGEMVFSLRLCPPSWTCEFPQYFPPINLTPLSYASYSPLTPSDYTIQLQFSSNTRKDRQSCSTHVHSNCCEESHPHLVFTPLYGWPNESAATKFRQSIYFQENSLSFTLLPLLFQEVFSPRLFRPLSSESKWKSELSVQKGGGKMGQNKGKQRK